MYRIMESYRCLSFRPQTWSATQEVAHKKRILSENVHIVHFYQSSCPIAQ